MTFSREHAKSSGDHAAAALVCRSARLSVYPGRAARSPGSSATAAPCDGPAVEPPSRKGFGSSLIQRLLATQCRAEIDFAYDRPGLRFRMSVSLIRPALDEMSPLRTREASAPSRNPQDGGMTQLWRGGTSSGPEAGRCVTLPRPS